MGLQLPGTTSTSEGFSTTSAYVNIQSASYRKGNSKLEVSYNTYKDKAARDAGSAQISRNTKIFEVTVAELEANYILTLAYAKLKSDVFPGSSDL